MPLNQLWESLHTGVILNESVISFAELQTQVTNLRKTYSDMARNGGGPNFSDAKVREAYALAYHPGHAHAYLQIMLNQGLGDSLIQGLGAQSSVGVLGAGAGAETLAFSLFCKSWISTRWSHPQPFRPSGLGCSASTVLYWQGPRDYGNASKKLTHSFRT